MQGGGGADSAIWGPNDQSELELILSDIDDLFKSVLFRIICADYANDDNSFMRDDIDMK